MTTTPRPRTLLALTTALAAAALLTACGGGSDGGADAAAPGAATTAAAATDAGGDSPATGEAPDPCSLVTAADLSSAYGVEFGEGATEDTDVAAQRGFRACKWQDSGGSKSFLLQTVASGDALGQTASELFDQSKALYPDAVDGGVGDKSLVLAEGGGFLAVSGDVFVQGNAIIFGTDTPDDATTTVMTTVVAALG